MLRFGFTRVYLISHPDLIEEVLVAEARNFIKHFALRMNRLMLGNGLLTSEGDFWLRQRRLIQPAFHRERIAGYGGRHGRVRRADWPPAGATARRATSTPT